MFTVRIRIANPLGELKDGMFARALIATERRQNVLVIPRSAVIVRGEGRSAVVAVDGKATIRALTLGPEDGDLVQVVAGLQEGDNIVIRGQQDLQAGESISVKAKGSR
jgi:membrane fusion protein (multidrug efflux system)